MKKLRWLATPVALAGVSLIAAGCGAGSGSQPYRSGSSPGPSANAVTSARLATVSTRHTNLGTVLVDSQGRTLYLFEKDKGMNSTCTGACSSIWPPLTSAVKAVAGTGLSAVKLGSVKRPDGNGLVTYAGHPLYTYVGDGRPGDTKGEGLDQFGAKWYVVAPNGDKIDNG